MSSAHAHDDDARARPAPSDETGAPRARNASRPDPLVGRTLAGKYEVLALLGEGAMGRVYRARQIALDKEIAIKVLHRHLTGAERIEKRFHREARAASRLSHPNSLHVHDFGTTDDGTLYIAMELLDGEDLQTILDHDHPLSPARIGALLVPVLRALEEAHRAGIIHRDLKPENVVVQPDRSGHEHVKVCDFGIAKILDQEEGHAITVDGFVCGTPQYMAPEQGRGDALDHRADIYAAGVVLYQMLCGVVPFDGESALGVMTRHLVEEPLPPSRRVPALGIPRALEDVSLRALRKDPAERWQSAAEMADALEAAIGSLGGAAQERLGEGSFHPARRAAVPSTAPARRSRRWILLALVSGVVAASALLWLTRGGDGDAPPGPGAVAAPPPAPTRSTSTGSEPAPALPVATEAIELSPGEPLALEPLPVERAAEPGASPSPRIAPGATEPRAAGARARRDHQVDPAPPPEPEPAHVDAPARDAGELAFDEGRRRFLANDVPGAIARFEEARRLSPQRAEVHKQLGRAYMRAGDVARSIAAYRRYLELAPDAADRAVVERIIAQHR